MSGVKLTREAARKTSKVVKRVLGSRPSGKRGGVPVHMPGLPTIEGELTEALDAPSNGMTAATTAEMTVWIPDPAHPASGSTPQRLKDSGETQRIVNRSKNLEGEEGDYVIAVLMKGEWRAYWVDCEDE